jgi:hypothetical protein
MTRVELVQKVLDRIIENIKLDAASKNQRIPVNSFRTEVTENEAEVSGKIYAAHYFRYLVLGRGPGKMPPREKIEEWVEKNPDILAFFKTIFKNITSKSLAYIIARKIGREGTQIYRGERPGIDYLGILERSMPELVAEIARGEAVNILTNLQSKLR